MGNIFPIISQICNELIFVWILWLVIDSYKDFILTWKLLTVVVLITCLYGLYEQVMQDNPILQYEMTLASDKDEIINWSYAEVGDERGYRVQSIFEHPIGGGCNWALYVIFSLFFLVRKKGMVLYKNLCILTVLLCVPCILFSNCRTPIVFLMIGCLYLLNPRRKNTYVFLIVAILLLFVFAPFFKEYENTVLSIFSSSAGSKVGGSNSDMRYGQFLSSISLMSESPLVGLGPGFLDKIVNSNIEGLLGFESIWFVVLPTYGLLGCFAYLFFFYESVVRVPFIYKSSPLFFISLAFWIIQSISSLPGFIYPFYYFCIFFFIKSSKFFCLEKSKHNNGCNG